MEALNCILIGAPVQSGTDRPGCLMGPDAFRTAGLATSIADIGHVVTDAGNVIIKPGDPIDHANQAVHHLADTIAWSAALSEEAYQASAQEKFPIFLGGDHSLSTGTVPGVTRAATEGGRPQFVLWLDAHPDFHTLRTTSSGNLHGTPVAYFTGQSGFEEIYPKLGAAVAPENVCMMGIRSVDPQERIQLRECGIDVCDMRAIDEFGVATLLNRFLERVKNANGALHVSLDVDFLDPTIAPAVGTSVPGGTTFREAHLIMEILCDSGLVTSLDLVELNPFLDVQGKTAVLMVDLCASLLGRKVLDRPSRGY